MVSRLERAAIARTTDEAVHQMFTTLEQHRIKWNDFHDIGIDEWYHDYYYAEEGLYLIHERITDSIEFIEANSPKQAYERWEDIHKAYYTEDEFIMGEEESNAD